MLGVLQGSAAAPESVRRPPPGDLPKIDTLAPPPTLPVPAPQRLALPRPGESGLWGAGEQRAGLQPQGAPAPLTRPRQTESGEEDLEGRRRGGGLLCPLMPG